MSFDPSELEMTPVDELPESKEAKEKKTKKDKPRRKPTYSKSRYGKLAPVKTFNKFIVGTTNNTVLKHKKQKLSKDDCEVGEAVMYMVEYYTAIDINHPALVMMAACMGVAFTTIELMGQEDDPTAPRKKTTDVDIKADTK